MRHRHASPGPPFSPGPPPRRHSLVSSGREMNPKGQEPSLRRAPDRGRTCGPPGCRATPQSSALSPRLPPSSQPPGGWAVRREAVPPSLRPQLPSEFGQRGHLGRSVCSVPWTSGCCVLFLSRQPSLHDSGNFSQ